jgi:hypothetical protein
MLKGSSTYALATCLGCAWPIEGGVRRYRPARSPGVSLEQDVGTYQLSGGDYALVGPRLRGSCHESSRGQRPLPFLP